VKGPEFLALIFSLQAIAGMFINYNIVYCFINKKQHGWLTRHHSNIFHWLHRRLRWSIYIATCVWLGMWVFLFNEKDYWLAALFLGLYFFTRIPAWFVLGPRTAFLNRHNALKNLGPSGKIVDTRPVNA
jgi:Trk-type K+ transport system membrane component